jgi:hypothetical protein
MMDGPTEQMLKGDPERGCPCAWQTGPYDFKTHLKLLGVPGFSRSKNMDAKAQRGKELREKSLKNLCVSCLLGVLCVEIFRFLTY